MSRDYILSHADELADRFESTEFDDVPPVAVAPLRALQAAIVAAASADRAVSANVDAARAAGASWALIGESLGISGEAARRRYGSKQPA